LDHKIFSILVFYKTQRLPAPLAGCCGKSRTEKFEKDFSIFQFYGSQLDCIIILN